MKTLQSQLQTITAKTQCQKPTMPLPDSTGYQGETLTTGGESFSTTGPMNAPVQSAARSTGLQPGATTLSACQGEGVVEGQSLARPTQSTPHLQQLTREDSKLVVSALGAAYVTQRTYGAQGTDFEKASKVFMRVLEGYNAVQIVEAIKRWMLKSPDFPTPYDIKQILEPQPVFSNAHYNACQQRLAKNSGNFYPRRNADEKYVKWAEAYMQGDGGL